MHLFTRAVHLAIIKDIPAQFILQGVAHPAAIAPVVGILRQHGDIIPQFADQNRCGLIGQGKARQATLIGGSGDSAIEQAHFNIGQRRAILQPRRPSDHFTVIGKGVETNLRHLHPGAHGGDRFVCAKWQAGEQAGKQAAWHIDHDNEMTSTATERLTQVNGGLH